MTGRFTDDFVPPELRLSRRETRALAQRRAYERWNQELAKKYRKRTDAEKAYQDLTNLEHLATKEDLDRLNEILREEYTNVRQNPL